MWIAAFGILARPFYEALKATPPLPPDLPLNKEAVVAINKLKQNVCEAPALGLPNYAKDLELYVHEQQGAALRGLTQKFGSWK